MYTGAVRVECVNVNHERNRASYFSYGDIEIARLLSKHVLLTAEQIKAFGHSTRRLKHMVRFGFIYRYRILTDEGSLPSGYAVGPAAKYFLGFPVVGISNPYKVQSMLAVNQVLLYLFSKVPEAKLDLNFHRPVQAIITINNPLGVCAPRKGFDRTFLSRHNIQQAIVVLPDKSMVSSGLPVRYCFDDEMEDPLNLKFYICRSGVKLEQVDLFAEAKPDPADTESVPEELFTAPT